jgi:hypothetical protein
LVPSIQFYADDIDFAQLWPLLSEDPEIAVILNVAPGRWIARMKVMPLDDGRYCLWHIPSGPLPLLSGDPLAPPSTIEDPFAGWQEQRSSAIQSIPFFGTTPLVVELGLFRQSHEAPGGIGQSFFGWIGDRYRSDGIPAAQSTYRWWRRLQISVKELAVEKITRWGPIHGPTAHIWAFPSAHAKILSGVHRDANPSA